MDEYQNYSEQEEFTDDNELSHPDKAVGVISEPSVMFSETAKFPPKFTDWIIPLAIFLLLVLLSQFLQNNNPEISYDSKQKQIEALEKRFETMIKEGQITREEADRQIDNIQKMDFFALRVIGTVFSVLFFFFLIAAIYFLFGRYVFKGDGSYSSALVASALPMYIGVIEILIYTIGALLLGQGMANASLGSFMGILPDSTFGLLMWMINPIALWMYVVIGIGLAKMFKRNVTPFIALTLAIYLLSNLLVFAVM
jgi:hypothetical protein